jgi:hypothetical protein
VEGIKLGEVEKGIRKFNPDDLTTEGHHMMHIMDNGNLSGKIL